MWLSLEEVQCFHTVMDEGSINSASLRLHKAKSAVRYSIQKLEEQLGFPLFLRGGYRLKPTQRGREFYEKSLHLLQEAKRLESYAQQLRSGQELSLSISCTELYSLTKFNQTLKQVLNKFPDTEIKFQREILSGEKMLIQGAVDVAFFESIKQRSDLEFKEVELVKLKLVIAKQHKLLSKQKKDIQLKSLHQYPQIVQRSTIASDESIGVHDQALKWYVSDTLTKKQIILDGLGWGRLPDHEVDPLISAGKLAHLDFLEDDDEVKLYVGRRKSIKHGVVSDYIWDLF